MPDPTIVDGTLKNPDTSDIGSPSTPATGVALVERLRLLAKDHEDDVAAASRRQFLIRMSAVGVVLLAGLMFFLAATIWRLHGPQFRILDDGWYHVTDREWGFECELPGWYTRRQDPMMRRTEYTSQFTSNWESVSIVAQPWTTKNSIRTATGELLSILAAEQGRGTVIVLIDNSSNPTTPMIDYIVEYGAPPSPSKMRRRVQFTKNVRLDITIQPSNYISESSIDRVMGAIKWIR